MFYRKPSPVAQAGKFFLMFVAGAAVGAAAGLLLAPKAGKKLQKDLRSGIEDLTEKALKLASA